MPKDMEEPKIDETGHETHPAFGMASVSRVSASPGRVLFDSDIKHREFIRFRVHTADRKREIKHDWIHPDKMIIEVDMSMAQWAAVVSSINGSAVPVTINYHQGSVPDFTLQPRLALSMGEVHDAAHEAFAPIKDAFDRYQDVLKTGTAKEKREALRRLEITISNATSDVDYAGKTLVEHAENVVQKSKADVEAMVINKAHQLGIEPSAILELTDGER